MNVYLSGPIYPDNKEATEEWRKHVTKFFTEYNFDEICIDKQGIYTIDPCRAKATYQYGYHTPNEIVFRDLKDVDKSDLLLANFQMIGDKLALGTAMEVLYAWKRQKPVVVVGTDPRIMKHPWLLCMSTRMFEKLDDALQYIVEFWGD